MIHLLLDTDLSQEQRDYVETMRRSSDGLLSIVNDILDFSKVFYLQAFVFYQYFNNLYCSSKQDMSLISRRFHFL
jgi:hypothetical protein